MSDKWITQILAEASPLRENPSEDTLIEALIERVSVQNGFGGNRNIALAAAFDLLVAAEYYGAVDKKGWLYCTATRPLLLYPYTNTCPSCLLNQRFSYHPANKPRSGMIGNSTARLLSKFMAVLLNSSGKNIEVLRGREPVDIIFVDRSTQPTTVFFAEIKASPLITFPLCIRDSVKLVNANASQQHTALECPADYMHHLELMVPVKAENGGAWTSAYFPFAKDPKAGDAGWAYSTLRNLISDTDFFSTYVDSWQDAFEAYSQRDATAMIYWLTNGCGQPNPRPQDWPKRRGSGYESVSDSKTSVGMDRTDDIKKATYQVLKMNAEGKPSTLYDYKVGILSNIHAVRHFATYLENMKDMMWTRDTMASNSDEVAMPTLLYNLFDGIVTLTSTYTRDNWLKESFAL